ncbi:TerB N-terminal domain-containing protein [Candidatus Hodarchaeum mangrovi]
MVHPGKTVNQGEFFSIIIKVPVLEDQGEEARTVEVIGHVYKKSAQDSTAPQKIIVEVMIWGYFHSKGQFILNPKETLIGTEGYSISDRQVKLFLFKYLECLRTQFPLKMLNYIVYSSVYGSDYCKSGNFHTMQQIVTPIIEKINEHFEKTENVGIFQFYQPNSKFNLIVSPQITPTILIDQYFKWLASNVELKRILSEILNYIELKIQRRPIIKKLFLDLEIQTIINNFFHNTFENIQESNDTKMEPRFAEYEINLNSQSTNFSGVNIQPLDLKKELTLLDFKMKTIRKNITNQKAFFRESTKNNFDTILQKEEQKSVSKKPRFVPFKQYWPTLQSMTEDQRTWYDYWVEEIRANNFIRTDLSYIFVLIYDILEKGNREGFNELTTIWINYRKHFPKLDRYLIQWITDYVLLYEIQHLSTDILTEILVNPTEYIIEGLDSILNIFKVSFNKMPIEWINTLGNNDLFNSPFYLIKTDILNDLIPQIFHEIDKYLIDIEGGGILEKFQPSKKPRFAFERAALKPTRVVELYPYSKHIPLLSFISDIIRQLENKLKLYYRFKDIRKSNFLDKDIEKIIENQVTRFLLYYKEREPQETLSFIEFAKKNIKKGSIDQPINLVPLYAYRPDFREMTESQLKYYYFFRANIRKERYIETQLGYILLYAYEIINNLGIESVLSGYQNLLVLWLNYRNEYSQLDELLPEWIIEYLIVQDTPVDIQFAVLKKFDKWLNTKRLKKIVDELRELLISQTLTNEFEIDLDLYYDWLGYSKTPYYQRLDKQTFNRHVKAIMKKILSYYKNRFEKNLFQYFNAVLEKRIPFSRARYYGENKIITFTSYPPILKEILINILKYIQNRLREAAIDSTKGSLKVNLEIPEIRAIIDHYCLEAFNLDLTPEISQIALEVQSGTINLDRTQVRKLTKDSEVVQSLLSTSEEFEELDDKETKNLLQEAKHTSIENLKTPLNENISIRESLLELWHSLTPNQQQIIKIILKAENLIELITKIADEQLLLPQTMIEQMNEIALEIIGDLIIDSEHFTLIEEYKEEFEFIIS